MLEIDPEAAGAEVHVEDVDVEPFSNASPVHLKCQYNLGLAAPVWPMKTLVLPLSGLRLGPSPLSLILLGPVLEWPYPWARPKPASSLVIRISTTFFNFQ